MKKKLLFIVMAFLPTTIVFAQNGHLFTREDIGLSSDEYNFIQFGLFVVSAWGSYAMNVRKKIWYLGYFAFPLYLGIFYSIHPYDLKLFIALLYPLVLGCLIGYVLYKIFFVKSKA